MVHGDVFNVLWPNESGVHCWYSGPSRAGFVCEASVLQSDWQEASEKGAFIHLCCVHAQHAMPERILIKSFYLRTSNLVMTKYVRNYWCAYAEIKDTFQVALSAPFLPVLSLFCFTYWQLLLVNLYYYRDFRLYCCLLSFWQQVTCLRNISSIQWDCMCFLFWVLCWQETHSHLL